MTAGRQHSTLTRSHGHLDHSRQCVPTGTSGYRFSTRIEAPRCLVPRVACGSSTTSPRAGRDDVPVPATPCFTVDADDADFFAGLAQVDPEGIGFIKKRCVGAFVTR